MKRNLKFIYALYSPAFPFRVKYGISDSPRRRASEVAYELSATKKRQVVVRVALAMPSLFSKAQEGKIHDTFRMFRADMPVHSGGTEWFWWMNIITSIVCAAVGYFVFGIVPTFPQFATLAVLSAVFFPVDAALVVLAVFLWEVKWIALFVFFAVNVAMMYF